MGAGNSLLFRRGARSMQYEKLQERSRPFMGVDRRRRYSARRLRQVGGVTLLLTSHFLDAVTPVYGRPVYLAGKRLVNEPDSC